MHAFPKYARSGAYHWKKLEGRSIRNYHARLWARYDWFRGHVADIQGIVVDVGAGDAALTHLLTGAGRNVIGLEPERDALPVGHQALAAVCSAAELHPGDAYELPFGDGKVAAIVLCEVIEHLDHPEIAVAEACRALRPDGILLISTPNAQSELVDPLHVHEFTPDELEHLLAASFDNVEVALAEPRWLLRLYATRPGRVLVNALALAGRNPFERHCAEPRSSLRQLYARASSR